MGLGGVAIAALPTVIFLKVPFSDGLGGAIEAGFFAADARRRSPFSIHDIVAHGSRLACCGFAVFMLLLTISSCKSKGTGIYVCLSRGSECYHNNRACIGLCHCGGEVVEITADEALRSGRRPCGYCYGNTVYDDEDWVEPDTSDPLNDPVYREIYDIDNP